LAKFPAKTALESLTLASYTLGDTPKMGFIQNCFKTSLLFLFVIALLKITLTVALMGSFAQNFANVNEPLMQSFLPNQS
jgi:hypothetical protein